MTKPGSVAAARWNASVMPASIASSRRTPSPKCATASAEVEERGYPSGSRSVPAARPATAITLRRPRPPVNAAGHERHRIPSPSKGHWKINSAVPPD
jgi:hypothetical protein